jgi:predicted anti-sigma-YlaC factor YlaD
MTTDSKPTCRHCQLAIEQRAGGAEPDVPAPALDQHLAHCPECRQYADLVATSTGALRSLPTAGGADLPRLLGRARWRLAAPVRRLAWTLLLITASLVVAGSGFPHLYLLAGGLLLVVLPSRLRAVRQWRAQLRELEAAPCDLIAQARAAAGEAMVGAFLSGLLFLALGLAFAALLPFASRPPVTGAVAVLLLLFGAWQLLVAVPAHRRAKAAFAEAAP